MPFFRAFNWLEPYVEIARLGVFIAFVAVALWHFSAIQKHLPDAVVRFRAQMLIAFILLASIVAGVTQIEAWPFTNWPLVHSYRSTAMTSWEIEGVGADGRAGEIDPRILQPLQPEEFGAWVLSHIERMTPGDRDALLAFVLQRANEDRARFLDGHFPRNDYILGALSAPAHFAMRRVWRTAAAVPSKPYVTVRIWRFSWNTEIRDRQPNAVTRVLLAEYPRR